MSTSTLPSIVITGVGLTSPLGNDLPTFRQALLQQDCGLSLADIRYMGEQVVGFCDFDDTKHMTKKALRRGTRAGAIGVYCAQEALLSAGINVQQLSSDEKSRIGIFVGITEHGNVETEQEIYLLHQHQTQINTWSPHHNPRTVANSPAGEVSLILGTTGPSYTIGAACAGGNAGIIQGLQMLQLGEVDVAIAGGISESPRSFGIFAGFKAQGALAFDEDPKLAIRPLDVHRKGTVISEGGCFFILETLERAMARGAPILGQIVGHAINSDAHDYVNPLASRQIDCMVKALRRAQLNVGDIDIINLHATATGAGDIVEMEAVRTLLELPSQNITTGPSVNFTKGHIGHAMGAAGALELAGNLPSFTDGLVHPGRGLTELDPACSVSGLVYQRPVSRQVNIILNNSFGMMGINSAVVVKKWSGLIS